MGILQQGPDGWARSGCAGTEGRREGASRGAGADKWERNSEWLSQAGA